MFGKKGENQENRNEKGRKSQKNSNKYQVGLKTQKKSAFENVRKIANWAHCVLSKFPIMDRPCNLKSFGMVAVSSDSVFLG